MRIEQDCHDLRTDQSRELERLRIGILDSLGEHSESFQQLTSAQLGISRQLEELQSMITTIPIQHRILRHLIPDERGSRRDQILEADPDTCRWILEPVEGDEDYRKQIRDDFISWLRTGSNVLHISGNPGAGKSTLMKFIGGNPRTQEELKAWAGNRELIFGQFYFWAAGIEAQRTLPGMLKSLLFQVLIQSPSLIKHVFPRQLRQMKISRFQSDPSVEKFQDFGNTQIQEAFDHLLDKADNSDHRICFLIDGLDEFQGDDLVHEDLAAKLKSWTTGGEVKLLVSSRPWRPFRKMFTDYPTLHLHELNRADIRTYAISQLEQDREIRQIGFDVMKKTIDDIVEKLVDQAQGIFLWAHLVLHTVRQDIRRRYSADLLMAKMREYPSDLDDLYDALREPIEKSPIDMKLSNRMLLLACNVPEGFILSALAFSWLLKDDQSGLLDPNFPPSIKSQPYSWEDSVGRVQCVAERVGSLTRGLLQIYEVHTLESRFLRQKVEFCHRTARDYLVTNAKRYAVLEESWPQFHQSDPYGRIYLAELIYSRVPESLYFEGYLKKSFCKSFSPNTVRKFKVPLRPLLHRIGHTFGFQEDSHFEMLSFLQHAADCRLNHFVLSEMANSPKAYLQWPGTSILLTSVSSALAMHKSWDLVLNLLRFYTSKENIVDVDVQIEHSRNAHTALPLWVVASILVLENMVKYMNFRLKGLWWGDSRADTDLKNSSEKVTACRVLGELGLKLGQKISVTLAWAFDKNNRRHDWQEEWGYFDGTEITLSTDQLLELVEHLNSGSVDLHETEAIEEGRAPSTTTSGWVSHTVCEMVEKMRFNGFDGERWIASWRLDGSPTVSAEERFSQISFRAF